MRICPFCKKRYENRDTKHLHKCGKSHGIINPKERRYLMLRYNIGDVCERNKLIFLYEVELKSLPDLYKEYGLDYGSTKFLLQYHNIKNRTITESANRISKHKYKEHCLKKYGKPNVLSKGTEFYNKRNETVKNKYGVSNVFQLESVINKIKNDSVWLEKYGQTRKDFISMCSKNLWESKTDEQKSEWLKNSIHKDVACRKVQGYFSSKLESRIQMILDCSNITYTKHFRINLHSRSWRFYDFLITGANLLIEVNGDYWHANPKMYKKDDIIHYKKFGNIMASDVWERDDIKRKLAENNGYKIIYIWESDMKNMIDSVLNSYIIEKMSEVLDENKKNT